ncbi:MAG: hypothetical protein HY901_26855 [Deltaproteobacteria bacterium]|nr:hypothetical protein [Deltaproteobacteria bacterium]
MPADHQPAACGCGHRRGHHLVSAEASYSPLGWLGVVLGISMKPIKVRFRCRRCDVVFDESTDPQVLDSHA